MDVQFENVKAIFLAAVERATAEERAAYLDQTCAGDAELRRRVDALLKAADESGGFLDKPVVEMPGTASLRPIPEVAGSTIGRYKLLQQIGEGGFGVVFMAEQLEPVRRKVALKIIKPGMDTKEVIARFESERQALALMDHPNIARVLDAGATESGQPFFVMELVRGVPFTEYCDKNNLLTHQRLELFAAVCHAVQHAHQKGLIHRDLKPSNILVTLHDGKPVPSVIDFGVAKATNQQLTERTLFTQYGQMIGTPAYMSPEQAEMSGLDVDTRSDIYSLGVLLYELLTGVTPFDAKRLRAAGYAEMLRIIREEEPPRPSTRLSTMGDQQSVVASHHGTDVNRLRQLLHGDLDWIVMKALDKDRSRRYETANHFAADVERFLNHQAVEARPASTTYKLKKFAQRNRTAVASAAIVVAALLIATVVSVWQAIRAGHERDRAVAAERLAHERLVAEQAARADAEMARKAEAEQRAVAQKERDQALDAQEQARNSEADARREAAIARAISDFLNLDLLAQASPERQPNRDIRLRDVLDRAAAKIENKFADEPAVEAAIRHTLGFTFVSLGLHAEATPHLERALELRRSTLGEEHRDTLITHNSLAATYQKLGQYSRAESMLAQTLDLRARVLGEEHRDTLVSMHNLAAMYDFQRKYADAEVLYLKTLEARRRVLGDEHRDTLLTTSNLAVVYQEQEKHAEAEPLLVRALEAGRRVMGEEHPYTLSAMNNMAGFYRDLGKYAEAEPLYLEALALRRRVLTAEHPDTLTSLFNLAGLYQDQGDYAKAEPLAVEALDLRRRVLSDEHPVTIDTMHSVAELYALMSKYDAAERLYRLVLEIRRRRLAPQHPGVAESLAFLGANLLKQKRFAEAEPLLREALAIRREQMPDDWKVFQTQSLLGESLAGQGKFADAEPLLVSGYKGLETRPDKIPTSVRTTRLTEAIQRVITLYDAWGKPEQAARWREKLDAAKPNDPGSIRLHRSPSRPDFRPLGALAKRDLLAMPSRIRSTVAELPSSRPPEFC